MNALEELIRQAINEGKFDHLAGEGKPLSLEDNPLEDPQWRLANKILADSGFAPGWIQKKREIEGDFTDALKGLQLAWGRFRSLDDGQAGDSFNKTVWRDALERFHKQVDQLNKRIRVYNLEAPSPQFQRKRINPQAEIERITSG